MKILFLSHRLPFPPNKGEKVRAFQILKYLSRKHDIFLATFYEEKNEKKYFPEIEKYCKYAEFFYISRFVRKIKDLLGIFSCRPISYSHFFSFSVRDKISRLINNERFDIIFVYSSSMAQYVINAKERKIMDFVDCDSAKWSKYAKISKFPMNIIYQREHLLARNCERKITENFNSLFVVSNSELKEFANFLPTEKFHIMVNGVDTVFFRPFDVPKRKKIIFTGALDYLANIDGVIFFSKSVFPLIKNKIPEAEFYIIGRNPGASIKALSKINGVIVTGPLEDIRQHMQDANVSIAPSFRIAQGVQNKILEAMACAIPVVTTSKALLGLEAEDGINILIADKPNDFANQIIRLMSDEELRQKIGQKARDYIERKHSWEKNLSILDETLSSAFG